MKKYESRLMKLEEKQPQLCMIGLRYQGEQSINWSGVDYPDWPALSAALEKLGLQDERFIILTLHRKRP
jgi:hypothetical protein